MISKTFRAASVCVIVGFLAHPVAAFAQPVVSFSDKFKNLRNDPRVLHTLFRDMPLGGDLHSHLSGALAPDIFIDIAKKQNYQFAFTSGGDFVGFVPPGRRSWNANPPTFLQEACTSGQIGPTSLDCLDESKLAAAHENTICDGLTIDDRDPKRSENVDFDDFSDIFKRADDLTDNTDVMPELIHAVMDQASDLNISYLELKMSPYGRANTQGSRTREKRGSRSLWNDDLSRSKSPNRTFLEVH